MARFYPTIDDDFHGSDGEIQVYQALQQLSDGYVVFHSFRWLGESGQYRSEGEGDFIIFHPTKGILSIEVKSGGIGYEEGSWIQINRRNNSKKRINPLGQAAETQYRIQRILRQHFPYDCPMIGRAAWFTSVAMDSKLRLPAEAVPEIILDQLSLAHPEEALDKVYAYWKDHLGRSFTPLKPPEFKALIQTLMPSFRIAETISSSSRETKTSYVQLTNQQFSILRFLQEQRTAAIYGPAGTGKTMLAVEKARMLASQGKRSSTCVSTNSSCNTCAAIITTRRLPSIMYALWPKKSSRTIPCPSIKSSPSLNSTLKANSTMMTGRIPTSSSTKART